MHDSMESRTAENTGGHATEIHSHHNPQEHEQHHAGAGAGSIKRSWIGLARYREYLLPSALYLIIALVNFWPITLNPATTIAGVGGDPYQMLWHLWWVPYSIFTLHQSIWQTGLLYWPIGANLVYETMIPIASLLSAPFQLISLPFAYNFIFFSGFVLSGIAMYILAKYLTGSRFGAFVAGLVFTYSAFHISQAYGHLQYANLEWTPLAIYLFLRLFNERENRLGNSVLLGITMVLLLFTAGIDIGVITFALIIVMAIAFLFSKQSFEKLADKELWMYLGLAAVVAFIAGSWAFIPIIESLAKTGLGTANYLNDIQHNISWSDDLLSFFLPSFYNGIFNGLSQSYWQIFHYDVGETTAYITYTVLALAVFGAWKNQKESRLWIAVIAVFGLLSLGPVIQIFGSNTNIPGPFYLYKLLPVFSIIREPGRFDLIVMLAFSLLAGYGARSVNEMLKKNGDASDLKRRQYLAIAAISIMFLIESNGMPLSGAFASGITTHAVIPPFYSTTLSTYQGNFSVLQLPVQPDPYSITPELAAGKAMFYMTVTGRPILGGYTTRENNTQLLSLYQVPLALQATTLQALGDLNYNSPLNQDPANQTLLSLYNYNTGLVVLDKGSYNSTSLPYIEGYLLSIFGAPIYNDNYTAAFATQNAIENSVFKSYVGYPVLLYWSYTQIPAGSGNAGIWVPNYPGEIIEYAPYPAGVAAGQAISSGKSYEVNTTMHFTALALGGVTKTQLYVYQESCGTSSSPIAVVNVTALPKIYSLPLKMVSGPQGNRLCLISGDTNSAGQGTVGIINITLSEAK